MINIDTTLTHKEKLLSESNESKFYTWYLETNRQNDIKNQQNLIVDAQNVKNYLLGEIEKLPKRSNFLLKKLEKNIEQNFRGLHRQKEMIGFLDEIMDGSNSSALLYWCKSTRKQGVEKLQKQYIKQEYSIDIFSGKEHNLTSNGPNSLRLNLKTGQLLKGVRKNDEKHSKSVDGFVNYNQVKDEKVIYTFQKVTTDDGGGTNSVEVEAIVMVKTMLLNTKINVNSPYWVLLLDGPYWLRKQHKDDIKNRFEKLLKKQTDKIIICTSDTLKSELEKRELLKY
jgi:hypothetical protein